MSSFSDPALSVNQLPLSVEIPREIDLSEILSLLYKRIANVVNTKEGAFYDLIEQGNFEQFFTPGVPFTYRPDYRKTFDFVGLNGANIPAGATVAFPHGIIGLKFNTWIWCSCTSVNPAGEFFTVVFPQARADNVNVTLTNPSAFALNSAIFVFEYLKV